MSDLNKQSNGQRTFRPWPPIEIPIPIPIPDWPWLLRGSTSERSNAERGPFDLVNTGPELLKRFYARPDHRAIIQHYTAAITKRVQADPEAMAVARELFEPGSTGDRAWQLAVGGAAVCFLAGFAYGFVTEMMAP